MLTKMWLFKKNHTNQKCSIHACICSQHLMKSITYRSEVRPTQNQQSNVISDINTVIYRITANEFYVAL